MFVLLPVLANTVFGIDTKHHRDSSSLNKIHKIVITIKILNTGADRFEQTVKTLIILLLKEESDQVKLFVIPSAFLRCTEKIN